MSVYDLDDDGESQAVTVLSGPRKEVLDLAFSPTGEVFAAVDASGALYIYQAASHRLLTTVAKAHSGSARSVSFTIDGAYVLTGGHKGRVKAWTDRGVFFAELEQGARHEEGIVMVSGVGPGHHAISVGEDRQIILWNVDTQRAVRPTQVDMDVRSAAVGGDGKMLALGMELLRGNVFRSATLASPHEIQATDTVRLIDTERGIALRDLEGEDQELDAVGVSPDGRFVAAGGSDASISIWETGSGKLITSIPLDHEATTLEFSPDGRWLATGTKRGSVSLYRLTGVGPARPPQTPSGQIIIVIIEPETVIFQGDSGRGPIPRVSTPSLRVRGRIKTPSPIKTLQVGGKEITSVSITDSGDYLFTAFVPLLSPGQRQIDIVAENQAGEIAHVAFAVERLAEIQPPPPGEGRRIALIVGISDYADDSIDLDYAHRDAKALYDLLTSSALGPAAFKSYDVMLLLDQEATVANINIGLRQFIQQAREDDFVLLFFAGHGVPDPNRLQNLYLLAHDTNPKDVAGTGILAKHAREAMAEIRARHVLILIDSCHSAGIAAPGAFRSLKVNPIHDAFLEKMRHASSGLAILTASEAAQVSVEGDQWGGHGVFTHFLLEGLEGAADENGDRIVAVGEIMEYVREQVRLETGSQQIPAIGPTSFDRELPFVLVGQN